ncbi:MAG: hypothetical protein KDB88_03230 [Flavobacteriales bacterium]|nr:hypothetical protein [Flavobacteriales bacterium]
MWRKASIGLYLMFCVAGVQAQPDMLVEAFKKYQEGSLNEARALVDETVTLPQHAVNAEAWLLRGFVYKDLFKEGNGEGHPELREVAMESLEKCLELDTAELFRENANKAYDFLARTYFNDAARALNEMDPERAEGNYAKFSDAIRRMGKEGELTVKDVEFNNALGTVYTKLYNQDREAVAWYDRAVATFKRVLELDRDNYGANYNLATLFYNRGVFNIQRIGAHSDIPSIQRIQEVSREFFLDALPYMLKAFEMNPSRRETLLGLEGIYYSLQDPERSEHYRRLYEQLGPEEGR